MANSFTSVRELAKAAGCTTSTAFAFILGTAIQPAIAKRLRAVLENGDCRSLQPRRRAIAPTEEHRGARKENARPGASSSPSVRAAKRRAR